MGLVAAGYDRVRNENSVMVYNVSQYSTKGSNQEVSQATYSFVPNETIYSTAFYNETNLIVGSTKILRDIDIRVSQPAFQVPSKTVHSIMPDPFNPFLFSGFADDGTLSIYDRRKLSNSYQEPLLSFSKLLGDTTRKNNTSCFRYHPTRRCEFSTSHGGELIRRWQAGVSPGAKSDSLFVASVQDVKTKYDRVISFDYASEQGTDAISLVCMRMTGSVFKMPVTESQKAISFNSFNDFAFAGSQGSYIESVDEAVLDKVQDLKISNDWSTDDFDDLNDALKQDNELSVKHVSLSDENEDEGEEDEEDVEQQGFYSPTQVLENDISVRMRRKAYMGYGMNGIKNVEIIDSLRSIDNNLYLRSTWRWLDIVQNSAQSKLMTAGDLDLSFEGVLGIWKGVDGLQSSDTTANGLTPEVFKQRISQILKARNTKAMTIVKSNKEPQRRLCMIIAGFYFSRDELEQIYMRLMNAGSYTKAAGWAVFVGDVGRAVKILSESKSSRLRLIATAISGYLVQRDSKEDNMWRDQCRSMASEIDDPYLRAIFAYIADNDWWDVLDESTLPLRERIGVALRCLSDKDLSIFLNKVSERYITKGELEGLILTGITPRGIDLMQSYVDRTSDVQTAALIASIAVPKHFTDERAEHWIHCYRQLLNSWGMFSTRAKFDVARAKLQKSSSGKAMVSIPSSQVQLQCVRCNKNVHKPPKSKRTGTATKSTIHNLSSCPHCGAALPKCAICLLPLGRPVPRDVYTNQNDDAKRADDFKEWPSFCLTCNHGMHAGHAEEWFSKSSVCPVPGCSCRCNNK